MRKTFTVEINGTIEHILTMTALALFARSIASEWHLMNCMQAFENIEPEESIVCLDVTMSTGDLVNIKITRLR